MLSETPFILALAAAGLLAIFVALKRKGWEPFPAFAAAISFGPVIGGLTGLAILFILHL